jgi:hypothetical protein
MKLRKLVTPVAFLLVSTAATALLATSRPASRAEGEPAGRRPARAADDRTVWFRDAKALADLFANSTTAFMPVAPEGESFNMYGTNLPELIAKKIALMEKHRDDEPRVDPDFKWRLPPGASLDPKIYLRLSWAAMLFWRKN